MSFLPALPLSGYAGWAFLKRSMPVQMAVLAKSPEIKRDDDYFRAKIGSVKTADDLLKDRRLLKVALGAFGLDSDINNTAFLRKVLNDGTLSADALSNRLADKQYQKFSAAFGFGDYPVPSTQISDFADKILTSYKDKQFEAAVGEQDSDLRLSLNVARELPLIAGKTSSSVDAKWFSIMGNTPLRKVFETALNLPPSLAALDIDQQLAIFKSRAQAQLGSADLAQFADPAATESLIRRFLVRSQAASVGQQANSAAAALGLMQQIVANGKRYR